MSVFEVQDFLRLTAKTALTDSELAGAQLLQIVAKAPSGAVHEFTASIGPDEDKVYYDLPVGSPLVEYGWWYFYFLYTAQDGRIAPGDTYKHYIGRKGVLN